MLDASVRGRTRVGARTGGDHDHAKVGGTGNQKLRLHTNRVSRRGRMHAIAVRGVVLGLMPVPGAIMATIMWPGEAGGAGLRLRWASG